MIVQILISLDCAVKSRLYIFLSLCQSLLKVDLWGRPLAVQMKGNLEKSEEVPGYLKPISSLLWGEELMTWISKLQPCIPHNVLRKRLGVRSTELVKEALASGLCFQLLYHKIGEGFFSSHLTLFLRLLPSFCSFRWRIFCVSAETDEVWKQ